MVRDANQQASNEFPLATGGGALCPRVRRRGGMYFSPDSAQSKWAAEAAQQVVWVEASPSTSSIDREAEAGAQVLRMMSVLSFD